jgi:hypothetical protein
MHMGERTAKPGVFLLRANHVHARVARATDMQRLQGASMNANDIPQHLAAIHVEARNLRGIEADLVVNFVDGTSQCSNRLRFFPDAKTRDDHMHKLCAWLHRTGRDRDIESLELTSMLGRHYQRHIYFPRRPEYVAHTVGPTPERTWRG